MTLHEIESELEQDRHRVGVFDTLGNRLYVAFRRTGDDIAHARLHLRIGRKRVHQLAVNLDVVRFQQVKNLKSFPVDAVMFERESDTDFAQLLNQPLRLLNVFRRVAFRNLGDKSRGVKLALVEFLLHPGGRRRVHERLPGQANENAVCLVFAAKIDR